MLVSVIVPCRDEARALPAFLDSLRAQRCDGFTCEYLVADGRSRDGSREHLEACARDWPALRVLDNPGGFVSTGLNLAISQARGEVIVRMDVHTEYEPSYIGECLRALIATGAVNVGGAARVRATTRPQRAIAAAYASPFSTGGARFHDETYQGPVDTVTYGCWWKRDLVRVGGFDEDLVRNQDDELNLRLARAGGLIWQSVRIVSWYHPRATLRAVFRQYLQYGYWKVAVIRKHRLPASWRHLVPCAFLLTQVGLLLSGLHWALAALLGLYLLALAGASIHTARRKGWDLLLLLPAAFAAFHYGYGLGFLAGIPAFGLHPHRRVAATSCFSQLTR